jgi:hypothetical protein
MSTLCRVNWEWQKHGGADLPAVAASPFATTATDEMAKVGKSEISSYCPTHFSAFQKCRTKGPEVSAEFKVIQSVSK